MSTLITANAHAIAAAAIFQGKNDVRYYLNGVLFEPIEKGGIRIVATNGHHIIVITDPEGTCEKATIITFESTALTKMHQEKANKVIINTTTLISDISGMNHISKIKIIDHKYPDYETVIPNKLSIKFNSFVMFDSQYMQNFAVAAKYLRIKNNAISFANDKNKEGKICILFGKCEKNLHAKGVLMALVLSLPS